MTTPRTQFPEPSFQEAQSNFEASLKELLEKYLHLKPDVSSDLFLGAISSAHSSTNSSTRSSQSPFGSTPQSLAESIRYSLLAPGKRIRPRLLLGCAEMLGLPARTAMPAAVTLEMLHCFTLIHDDLPCMDNDDFRRGLPSNHKKFDESTALLAGDALMALAVEVFLESPVQPALLLKGLKRLTWAMGPRGVIGGQAAEATLHENSQLDDLKTMHRQKTGALFVASLLIPQDFCAIPDQSPEGLALLSFADSLGLAFQMADDLEDEIADNKPALRKTSSILFYLSSKDAAQMASQSLSSATEQISRIWKEKASPLTQIAEEVLNKIKLSTENHEN